jgi:serine/threonine-protein kinase
VLDSTYSPTLVKSYEPEPQPAEVRPLTPAQARAYATAAEIDEAGFGPGVVLAERYRIRALLGRGGMGEVYWADDLKLRHSVALKFLPQILAQDGAALARFHREVRVARQVSHPNVCRVFDIGEVDGRHFISMEYIDGEDLASLLRRIGRLPPDKALQIARQLSAGLAAAHDNGILHRDLKPANIMLDGKGKARIMDFGLSSIVEEIAVEELRAGTPAYMAPEQISGIGASPRSDIYSLGLVLYELFTGKRAVDGPTLDSIIDQQVNRVPSTPSSILKEMDPRVEKAIMRCLEKDPAKRFASAIDLAAGLPGGDPVADALAAGETPSPEMVARAPIEGTLKPVVAVTLLAAVVAGLAISVVLAGRGTIYNMVPLEKSPDVLSDRARTILEKLGHADSLSSTASGTATDTTYIDYLRQNDSSPSRFEKLKTGRPPAIVFWYRGARQKLVPADYWNVDPNDPPFEQPGMTEVRLDTLGRLMGFRNVPDAPSGDDASATEPDWQQLFAEAGFDISRFTPAPPRGATSAADRRFAWDGVYPEQPDLGVHVEAGSLAGKPVFFQLQNPWIGTGQSSRFQRNNAANIYRGMQYSLAVMALVGSLVIAWSNLKEGRGDRRGAFRLFVFTLLISLVTWLLSANVFPTSFYLDYFLPVAWARPLGLAMLAATVIWLQYIAVEPFVRRQWPTRIVAWSRLLSGSFRDPLVGRDILIGAAFGVLRLVCSYLSAVVPAWLGRGAEPILYPRLAAAFGTRLALGFILDRQLSAITLGLQYTFILLLLYLLLRKQWVAIMVLAILVALSGSTRLTEDLTWINAAYVVLQAALAVFVLWRYGVLALIAFVMFGYASSYPLTSDWNAWYALGSNLALLFLVAVAVYGFYTSLGGRPVFKADPLAT